MRLTQRLPASFDSASPEQVQEYLDTLRGVWRDISAAISRNSWIILGLLTVYELASRGTISTITIGPIALAHLRDLRVFIPTIVSYLLYEQILLVERWMESEATHQYLMRLLLPKVQKDGFDVLLVPRLPALSNLTHNRSKPAETPSRRIGGMAQYVLALIMLALVPVFDAAALAQLARDLGLESVVYWINVMLTAALVVLAMAVLVLWLIEERLVW